MGGGEADMAGAWANGFFGKRARKSPFIGPSVDDSAWPGRVQAFADKIWIKKIAQIKFELLVRSVQANVIPLSGLHGGAEFFDAPAANRRPGRRWGTQTVASNFQIRIRQFECALIHQSVKESL